MVFSNAYPICVLLPNSYLTNTDPSGKRLIQPHAHLFCEHPVHYKRTNLYHLKNTLVSYRGENPFALGAGTQALQISKSHLGCHCVPAGGYCQHSGAGGDYASAPSSPSLHSPSGCFKARLVVGSVKQAALYPILSLKQFFADLKGW